MDETTTSSHERLLTAGWEHNPDFTYTPWRWPGVTDWETEADARRILDGELCPAALSHGPGHQSTTRCEKTGRHHDHECHYITDNGRVPGPLVDERVHVSAACQGHHVQPEQLP